VTGKIKGRPAAALADLGLRRGLRPVQLPVALLLDPGDDLPTSVRDIRREVATEIRRRARHRHVVGALELAGLAMCWLGVALPDGRTLTLVGVAVTAAGALLGLTGKDRLGSLDSALSARIKTLTGTLTEALAVLLQVGPYSYAATTASGITVRDVLAARRQTAPADISAELADWVDHPRRSAADVWSSLLPALHQLARVDRTGRSRGRQVQGMLDRIQALLLVVLVVTAALSLSERLPDAVFAALASGVVLGGRTTGSEGTPAVPPGRGPNDPGELAAILAGLTRDNCTETTLRALLTTPVLVPRDLSPRRP